MSFRRLLEDCQLLLQFPHLASAKGQISGLFCKSLPGSLKGILDLFLSLASLSCSFLQPLFLLVSALSSLS